MGGRSDEDLGDMKSFRQSQHDAKVQKTWRRKIKGAGWLTQMYQENVH